MNVTKPGATVPTAISEVLHDHDLIVIAHGERPLADEDWAGFLDKMLSWGRTVTNRAGNVRVLVSSPHGNGPNAAQRAKSLPLLTELSPRIAVMTPSPIARGVVTAMSWVSTVSISSFAPTKLDDALRYLNVSGAHQSTVSACVKSLAAHLARTSRDTSAGI